MHFKFLTSGLFISLLLLGACNSEPPDSLNAESINWMRFSSAELGVELRIPDNWSIEEDADGSGVIFRQDGYPVMMISLLDQNQAAKRGLWAGYEPLGPEVFLGVQAQSYRYDHQDALFVLPTLSWVIPWRSRFLEVAFRTRNKQPDLTQQAILASMDLLDPTS